MFKKNIHKPVILTLILAFAISVFAAGCQNTDIGSDSDSALNEPNSAEITSDDESKAVRYGIEIHASEANKADGADTLSISETETAAEKESESDSETETAAETTSESVSESAGETIQAAQTETETNSSSSATVKTSYVVCIDAGHQLHGDSSQEAIGPGSSATKARVSSGTSGVVSGVPEYKLNLTIALLLKNLLEQNGIGVVMIRTTNDVSISNSERAKIANSSGADICVRIHADSSSNSSTRGAYTICMSSSNPWNAYLYEDSYRLSSCVIKSYCAATGFTSRGVVARDDLTGTNWSEIPVTLIEMGFMSNAEEDTLMNDASMQQKMAQGICNGILSYFGLN